MPKGKRKNRTGPEETSVRGIVLDGRLAHSVCHARLREYKIGFLAILKIQEGNYTRGTDGTAAVRLRAKSVARFLGWKDRKSVYSDVGQIAEEITQVKIGLPGTGGVIVPFPRAEYGEGVLTLHVGGAFVDLARHPGGAVCPLSYAAVREMTSGHAIRLYAVLMREAYRRNGAGRCIYAPSVVRLRTDLGIVSAEGDGMERVLSGAAEKGGLSEGDCRRMAEISNSGAFSKINDLERYCLGPAVEEINRTSMLDVSYEKVYDGWHGSISGVRFSVRVRGMHEDGSIAGRSADRDERQAYWSGQQAETETPEKTAGRGSGHSEGKGQKKPKKRSVPAPGKDCRETADNEAFVRMLAARCASGEPLGDREARALLLEAASRMELMGG